VTSFKCSECGDFYSNIWHECSEFKERVRMITRENAKKYVGKGWYKLIDDVYDFLPSNSLILQVKEKFGGLRIYGYGLSHLEFNFLDDIEEKSLTTCEKCGNSGVTSFVNGWWKTLCSECLELECKQDCKEEEKRIV